MYTMMKRNSNSKNIIKNTKIYKKDKLKINLKIYTMKLLKEKKIYKQPSSNKRMKNVLSCQEYTLINIINKLKGSGRPKNFQAISQLMMLV